MKILILLPVLACIVASCTNPHTDSDTDTSAAHASMATDTDTSANTALAREQLRESVAIDLDRAGIIHIGMSMAEVYQWFDSVQIRKVSEKKTGATGIQAFTLLSAESAPLMMFSVSASDSITGITIQNPAYQTEKGIGVGSTFSQLSRAYHISRIFTTKDKQVIATVEELQKKLVQKDKEEIMTVRFELGVDATSLLLENNSVLPSSIPPETRITRIFL